MSPPDKKRQCTDDYNVTTSHSVAAEIRSRRSAFLSSLNRGVSPPGGRQLPLQNTVELETASAMKSGTESSRLMSTSPSTTKPLRKAARPPKSRIIPSPFKLTRIRDLPAHANVDTIGVRDILGDVMLRQVWLFDFLFDVDWLMQQFDPDTRHLVSVVLVHGSWQREDSNKIQIDEASKRYPNVKVVTAYMPEMFGCHHSKCMVLLRHDDLAQVIIHTANMIEQDWRNLTQGVWLSPLLPIETGNAVKEMSTVVPAIGTGARFKQDFMKYLRHYGNRTASLVSQLGQHDFAAIRAALIAHVPAKFDGNETEPSALWGWPALKRALGSIPPHTSNEENPNTQTSSHIICQVSSIASLAEKWIRDTLFSTLSTTSAASTPPSAKNSKTRSSNQAHTKFSIIFPTPAEIRTCLDGYAAGASIHCKLQSAAQRKQFDIMKPHLCQWNAQTGTTTISNSEPSNTAGAALRGPAAPHIKTFIRFHSTNSSHSQAQEIDWALLTSANLSTQAWGTAAHPGSGEVRISSYELGVLVWADLFLEEPTSTEHETQAQGRRGDGKKKKSPTAKMIPTFGSDTPSPTQIQQVLQRASPIHPSTKSPGEAADLPDDPSTSDEDSEIEEIDPARDDETIIVGMRMPYDLPLTPYSPTNEVWSARSSYTEADVFGRVWNA